MVYANKLIVDNMMQYVVLDGNLLDEVVVDGNLLMSCLLISNLFVKDVKIMFLQVSSDVTEKQIPVGAREMKQEIFLNVYAGLMKATRI